LRYSALIDIPTISPQTPISQGKESHRPPGGNVLDNKMPSKLLNQNESDLGPDSLLEMAQS